MAADADLSPFAGVEESLAQSGIALTTLAHEQNANPDSLLKFCALFQEVEKDVPGYSPKNQTTFAQCVRNLNAPGMDAESVFIAKHDDAYVGLSIIGRRITSTDLRFAGSNRPDCLSQHLTGVLPRYRRQGIALALKVRTLQHAQKHNCQRVLSNSDNPAMRSLNKKLGFRAGPWLVYHKSLDEEAA